MKNLLSVFLVLLLALTACGRPERGGSLEDFTTETFVQATPGGGWSKPPSPPPRESSGGGLVIPAAVAVAAEAIPSGLMLLGESLWKMVIDGDFAADIQANVSHVLPVGAKNPLALSGWKTDPSPAVKSVFRDLLGGQIVELQYRILFHHSGRFRGHGHYLASITLIPESMDLKSLYRFDVRVSVLDPVNIGTDADPIAQTTVVVSQHLKDRLLGGEKIKTDEITLRGDGKWSVIQR